ERRQRGEVRARGRTEQADALGVDLDLGATAAHELHPSAHVVDRLRKHLLSLLGQAVADREQHVAARGEIGSPELEGVARARLPPAAWTGDGGGKWPAASRQVKIAEQRYAVMAGVGDPAAGLDRLRCRHCV